ncbi:MAG: hypothetical protein GY853_07225 [PVC group bacterium]|nr:hypothetical protein [PVC group bacterium]
MKKKITSIICFVVIIFNAAFILFCVNKLVGIRQDRVIIRKEIAELAREDQLILPSSNPTFPEDISIDQNKVLVKATASLTPDIPLKLLGIIQGSKNKAVIELINEKTNVIYSEGDKIGKILIQKIFKDKVLLNIHGNIYTLAFENSLPVEGELKVRYLSDNELLLNKKTLSSHVLDFAGEANKLKISKAVNKQGKGLKVSHIPQDGLIRELGLRNDDVIRTINGMQVDSVPKVLFIMNKLKSTRLIELGIIRNDLPLMMKYQLI